jgi:hypothetical protein
MSLRLRDEFGYKQQSAIGTAITSGLAPLPIVSISETVNQANFESGRQNTNNGSNISVKGQSSHSVTAGMELDATDCLIPLQELLGDVTTSADTPVPGAHQHVIIPTATAGDLTQIYQNGYTFAGDGLDDSTGVTYSGCITTVFEAGEIENGLIPVTWEMLSRLREEGTITTTGSVADSGTLFTSLQGVISAGVDASEVSQPFTVGSIRIEREGITPHYRASSNALLQYIQADGSMIRVTGSFEIEMSDTEYAAILAAYTNGTEHSVLMTYTTDIFITGSTPYSLVFDMPECKYTGVEYRTDGHLRFAKFTWAAGIDGGTNHVTVTGINGTAAVPT